ncbi:MAG: hypothetical protein ABIG60_03945 [Patescibacteria group bacterium]
MILYYNSLLIISLLAFYGAGVYRLYQLNYAGIFLTVIFSAITFILLKKGKKGNLSSREQCHCEGDPPAGRAGARGNPVKINNALSLRDCFAPLAMTALYISLLIYNFLILFQSSTITSIISPWQVVPWYFFITFTTSTLLLVIIILKTKLPNFIYFLLLTFHFLLTFSIALIVYTLGYGFDPFIHQATEKFIATQGFVDPKPFYYLGQYALVTIIHKLFFIPIVWIDKLLVPLASAIFLPPVLFHAIKSFGIKTKQCLVSTLFILIFPFSIFIITTPQNLAYLFLILIIPLSLHEQSNVPLSLKEQSSALFLQVPLALATLAIHPIAGIPAILFVAMFFFCHCEIEGRGNPAKIATLPFFTRLPRFFQSLAITRIIIAFLAFITAIALPLAFYLNNKTSSIINSTAISDVPAFWQLPQLFLSNTGNIWLNFSYLYGFNIFWIILIFISAGAILSLRVERSNPARFDARQVKNAPYFLMSSALLISYALVKLINFSYLIDYEQSNFADRILIIVAIFALPFILIALTTLVNKILEQNKIIRYSLFLFFTLLITTSFYHSYPRWDDYNNSRSYATSKSDVKAVQWIEQNSPDDNFIVLANQQVSAAALKEFGFKKYYSISSPLYQGGDQGGGKLFYYPIPTGEKLYQYYLDMVYQRENPPQADASKRAKETALEAADLVGVNTVYFVLNDYWFAFDKILAEAKFEADDMKNIDNQVYIFKYVK